MIGWLIALTVIAVFLITKVGVRFYWDSDSSVLKIRVGLIRFSLPTKEEPEQPAPKPVKASAPKKKGLSPTLKKWLKALWENREALLKLIGNVLRSPVLDLLRLHIAVGNTDPAACALNYGRICAGLSAGLPVLKNTFRVKKQDIDVSCRFDLPNMEIKAEVEASVRVYEVFAILGAALGLLLKLYRSTKSTQKAVQNV